MSVRKRYLINRLFDLNSDYLDMQLYALPLIELERLYIKELNKPLNVARWRLWHGR